MSPGRAPLRPLILVILCASLSTLACNKQEQVPAVAASEAKPAPTADAAQAAPTTTTAAPKPNFNGYHAMQYVKEVVAIGARPVGSPAHAKLEQYIKSKLKGDNVEDDSFSAQTPIGTFQMHNLIAKFPGKKDGIIVVAGHYDTAYPLGKNFVGANDGGSSTGLLLELADELHRPQPRDGYSVWLVWTDGEEALVSWTDTDSVYGTRHLAEKWKQDGTAKKIKGFILVDMIGDADLDIQKDTNSTPWLSELVYQAATDLGYQSHFYKLQGAISDDHLPLLKIGVPSVDIIDLDYGYNNVFWHTPQDTVDKLSPESLTITGDVVLRTIQLVDTR